MQIFPDFSSHNYIIIREFSRNREGGRISYLGESIQTKQKVVIKQFRFVDVNATWSSYKAYEREIAILETLDHPRIPKYLTSFETDDGFCLVQEYKNAPCLARKANFSPEQIQKIAISILEILVYLQHHNPLIIHRDIKPENILVDENLNAYLIDFGLAKIRDGKIANSTIAEGTPGFMPPEELFNRPLTESSDLYSIGATLICLLTQTPSIDISSLIDENNPFTFNFSHLLPDLNSRFITWLNILVNPLAKQRYINAQIALEELRSLNVRKLQKSEKNPLFFYSFAKLGIGFVGLTILIGFIKLPNFFLVSDTNTKTPIQHNKIQGQSTTSVPKPISYEQSWYRDIKPHCNTVEVITMMKRKPYPKTTQGVGFAAGCYALAGKIEEADKLIQSLPSQEKYKAAGIVFSIGHPVADAGDDESAGPIMELVIKYQPNNFMAVYHAGMSQYVLGNYQAARINLTKFLDLYQREDGWRNNAVEVLNRIK